MAIYSREIELWKTIESNSGYLISDIGRVKNSKTGKLLKGGFTSLGYRRVKIGGKCIYIHRLVAQSFIRNPSNKPDVNHKDGNKANNHASNLEWNTRKENINHAHKIGLKNHKGEKNQASRLTAKNVLWARENKKLLSYRELGALLGVSVSCINHAVTKKSWAHIG